MLVMNWLLFAFLITQLALVDARQESGSAGGVSGNDDDEPGDVNESSTDDLYGESSGEDNEGSGQEGSGRGLSSTASTTVTKKTEIYSESTTNTTFLEPLTNTTPIETTKPEDIGKTTLRTITTISTDEETSSYSPTPKESIETEQSTTATEPTDENPSATTPMGSTTIETRESSSMKKTTSTWKSSETSTNLTKEISTTERTTTSDEEVIKNEMKSQYLHMLLRAINIGVEGSSKICMDKYQEEKYNLHRLKSFEERFDFAIIVMKHPAGVFTPLVEMNKDDIMLPKHAYVTFKVPITCMYFASAPTGRYVLLGKIKHGKYYIGEKGYLIPLNDFDLLGVKYIIPWNHVSR